MVAIVIAAGLGVSLVVVCALRLSGGISEDFRYGLLLSVLLAGVCTSLAGVLSSGTFAREKFVVREGIRTTSNVLGGLLIFGLVRWTDLGVSAFGVGTLVAAVFEVTLFYISLQRMLPDIRLRLVMVSLARVREIIGFVGWMLLAYCGQYLVRGGLMVVVRAKLSDLDLGVFGLAVQVGGLALQAVTLVSYVTAPVIYKSLAIGDYARATASVQRFMFVGAIMTLAAAVTLANEGVGILRMWLGASAPVGCVGLLVAMIVSSGIVATRIPVSTFLAGCNRIRGYGIITLVEGVLSIALCYLAVSDGRARLVTLAAIPACTAVVKNVIVLPLMYRSAFQFSSLLQFASKGAVLLCLVCVSLALRWCVGQIVSGETVLSMGFRILALLLPFGAFLASRFASWDDV
jgi:O-antigen/teichoic acid export membrane protein